jgi:hypothetical protein
VTAASPKRAEILAVRVGIKLKKVVLCAAIQQAVHVALYKASQRLRSYGSREEPGASHPGQAEA